MAHINNATQSLFREDPVRNLWFSLCLLNCLNLWVEKVHDLSWGSAQWFHAWLATKCALLIYAVIHQGAFFMIENPMTSLVGILIHCRASCVQKSNMMDRIQLLNYLWWFVPCWCWVTMASPTGYPLWTPEHLRQLYLAGWIWIFPNGYTQANSSLE